MLIEDMDDPIGAMHVVERIQQTLAAPFELMGSQVAISASIGIAVTSTGEELPEDFVRNADIAMYEAKRCGNGQHVLFEPTMHTLALARVVSRRAVCD